MWWILRKELTEVLQNLKGEGIWANMPEWMRMGVEERRDYLLECLIRMEY